MGVGGEHHATYALPPGKRPVSDCTGGWVGPTVGLNGCEKSGIRSLDLPGRSESLYLLT